MRQSKIEKYIEHMVDALQRDHETNAVTWARLAEVEIEREMYALDFEPERNPDDRDDDYWEGYFHE